ncbi:DUF805 domain-containing protein [Ancylobacter terrae]|uniref:DUF805 domain-containing protein n=1 Tax=Ancylobacter sp. sgz301288 TaxID=3342077 RepID=UPI00385CDF77
MNFTDAIKTGFQKYATFEGRAARSEYWFWVLFTVLASWAAGFVDYALFGYSMADGVSPIGGIVNLALLVPSLAVGARRFHDMDRTGWWQLIALTGIGALVLFVWFCFRGTDGPNRFGPDPLD